MKNSFNGSPWDLGRYEEQKGVNGEMKAFNNFEIVSKLSQ
jgi:hypothetical protein